MCFERRGALLFLTNSRFLVIEQARRLGMTTVVGVGVV